ncbi:MAG TPA: hypothetical protein PLT76_09810 [Candidatus Omnitrophota bacterium]|nr:hypothetical protein [Candidatus Omnitrophota bacterium]HQO58997.1 hypothetical protein [Candidatus Omnitrophota bacterium]HQP12751.1 hypothetical protein [Candidatus Omnitrophota bacterium]
MSKKFILLIVVLCISWAGFLIVAAGRLKATSANAPYLEPLADAEYEAMIAKTVHEQINGKPVPIYYLWFTKDKHPDPLKLLRFLAAKHNVIVQPLAGPNRSSKPEIYKGWIGRDDMDELVAYVESNQPAAALVPGLTAFPYKSSVGKEAVLMIEAYRARPYPVGLGNGYPPDLFGRNAFFKETSQEDRAREILEWWETEKNKAGEKAFSIEFETTPDSDSGKDDLNAAIGWD